MALDCESIAEAILSLQHFVLFKTFLSIKICQKMFMA